MKAQEREQAPKEAISADQFLAEFRSDPENERLYRESEIRFGISEKMKALRTESGVSQQVLADRVGCSQPFIAKLEAGAYDRFGASNLRTHARALGYDISVETMFYRISEPVFTGHSSATDLQEMFYLQESMSMNIVSIWTKSWQAEPPKRFTERADVCALLAQTKEQSTAA